MEAPGQFFIYIYRDARGNPVYIGQGEAVRRALSHEAGASNPAFREWLEANERTARVEVMGPLGNKPMADAVETALISACKPAGALKLFNVAPGVGAYQFRPLGVPRELADRTTQPLNSAALLDVARAHGPLLFVCVNQTFDRGNVPSDEQILERTRGRWQVANRLEAWEADRQASPALLIAVAGGPGTQSIVASAAIDRDGWAAAANYGNGLIDIPLVGDDIDAADLRGRPILREVNLSFNAFRHSQFRLFGLKGLEASPATRRPKPDSAATA